MCNGDCFVEKKLLSLSEEHVVDFFATSFEEGEV